MPLTKKGRKMMAAMKDEYGEDKGESVFWGYVNKHNIKGVHGKSRHHKKKRRVYRVRRAS